MPWIIFGIIAGLIVGFFMENMLLWLAIGAGAGILIFLLKSMSSSSGCCCSAEPKESADEGSQKEE